MDWTALEKNETTGYTFHISC